MFSGFSKQAVDFLWDIRFNNNRPWFHEHKEEFNALLGRPMHELAEQTYAAYNDSHPDFSLTVHVSRIYRDARRLRGNGPLKDHLWLTFYHTDHEWTDKPAFWFELGPENWSYGLGYYLARPQTMRKHRARIDNDPAPLAELTRALDSQGEFVLSGEYYKKSKGDPGELLRRWYDLKTFSLEHTEKLSEVITRAELAERILSGYEFLAEFYRYFSAVDADPDPGER